MTIANVPASAAPDDTAGRDTASRAIGLRSRPWWAHSGPLRGTVNTTALQGSNQQYGAKKPSGKPAERPGQTTPQRPVRSSA